MKNLTPLVSVVMAVYNCEKYLARSIQSIVTQTLSNFEFIIINDGSTDGTKEILESFAKDDKRIRIVHQDNYGLSASLNRGCQLAKGQYIARMDADDISRHDRLEVQSKMLKMHPKAVVCHSLVTIVDSDERPVLLKGRVGFRLSPWQTRWTLLWRNCVYHPTVMMRRDFFSKIGFNYCTTAIGCEDYALWCRLSKKYDFIVADQPLLFYRRHPTSITKNYGETHIQNFSKIIGSNLEQYLSVQLSEAQRRDLAIISGQTYLHGRQIKLTTNPVLYVAIVETVISKFNKKHKLDKKTVREIHQAAARQFMRWAWKTWLISRSAAITFFIAANRHAIFR